MNNSMYLTSLVVSCSLALLLIYELIAEISEGVPLDILLLVRLALASALVVTIVASRKKYLEKPNS